MFAWLHGVRTSTGLPLLRRQRGKRSWSAFTHPGAKLESPFFQLPNQSNIRCSLFLRAPSSIPSTREKSYLPSDGSTQSQPTPTSTVLRFNLASCGHTVFMYARSDEAVLSVSPERTRYGLPSTINCVAAPRFSRWAMDESARVGAVDSVSAAIAARVQGMWSLMGGYFLRVGNRWNTVRRFTCA